MICSRPLRTERQRAASGARPADRRRAGVSARRTTRRQFPLQTRTGAGRSVRHAAAQASAASCTPGSLACWRRGFPRTPRSQPEILAHHCANAGLIEKAVCYWQEAGERSKARSAMAEAIRQMRKALDLLSQSAGYPRAPAHRTRTSTRARRRADRRDRAMRPKRLERPTRGRAVSASC